MSVIPCTHPTLEEELANCCWSHQELWLLHLLWRLPANTTCCCCYWRCCMRHERGLTSLHLVPGPLDSQPWHPDLQAFDPALRIMSCGVSSHAESSTCLLKYIVDLSLDPRPVLCQLYSSALNCFCVCNCGRRFQPSVQRMCSASQ